MPGKERSPNYPALSLPQAVAVGKKLWDSEKRAPVSHEAAAAAMGFKSLSGPARTAIGALRQYGLIDKAEKGHVRLSSLAVRIYVGDQSDKQAALREASLTPELFLELAKNHLDASENNIRLHLITKKGFVDDGARKAARAFRETLNLAKPEASGYTAANGAGEPEAMQGNDAVQNLSGSVSAGGGKPSDGVFSLNVPFSKGTISVQVRVTGDAISPAHLARVRRYLELAEQEWDGGNE